MATVTLGTAAQTSLTALQFSGGSGMSDADRATIAQAIKDDILGYSNAAPPKPARIWPDAFTRAGLLYVPNRGVLQVRPGDYVAVDTNGGWTILVSGNVIDLSGTPWVHT